MQPPSPQTSDAAPQSATLVESAAARPPGDEERRVGLYSRLKFEAVRAFLLGWARVFSLRGLYLLGRWFGAIEYLVNYKRRARYRRELQRVFPEGLSAGRIRRIVRNYFQRTRCDKLFYLIFDRLPRERIMRRIRFHGREYLDEGLARGRGVYVMLSHLGSHHVAGLLMALMGYRCAGVRDRNEGPLRQYIQQKYAETFPEFAAIRLLYADTFPREIYRCFQDNFIVGSALDVARVRGMTLKTCPVRIFGEQREFLTGTAQIALRSRAAIVQGFVVSRSNFYFRLVVRPLELPPGAEGDQPEVLSELMQRYADGIAAHAREHPDHLSRI